MALLKNLIFMGTLSNNPSKNNLSLSFSNSNSMNSFESKNLNCDTLKRSSGVLCVLENQPTPMNGYPAF
ncbi:hypothetical protein CYY_006808 [Polysphondylium violaceum]|uniref:Uncharacterized protein n=1 Tax=Polysphondylium violaceum TaxID=133409 RepID=A0A8J4URA5_9MYCE|nr:hypothetical protein CYY_006808 [Polysphondylium violaceum]